MILLLLVIDLLIRVDVSLTSLVDKKRILDGHCVRWLWCILRTNLLVLHDLHVWLSNLDVLRILVCILRN